MKKLMIVLLVGMLSLGLGTVAFASTTTGAATATTTIGGELILDVTDATLTYNLNPLNTTTGSDTVTFNVKTNAVTYGVTVQVTESGEPYDTIIAGSGTPNWSYDAETSGSSTTPTDTDLETSPATTILSGESGETNSEDTTLTCLMAIDYTVPDADGETATLTFTAAASY